MAANTLSDLSRCPDVPTLKQLARAEARLDDFGDPARDAGLDALLQSIEETTWPQMSEAARVVVVDYLSHQLVSRLKLVADRQTYHEIARQEIKAPLIVVG